MEGQRIDTTSGPETSQGRRLSQHYPIPRFRTRKQDKTTDATREENRQGHYHQKPLITKNTWQKPEKRIPEWILQIYNFLRPYSSYHIYTDGSYKKSSHKYDDIFLADNGPAHPDRIAAGASIIIAPRSEESRDKQYSPLLCIHIKDGSSIGAQSVYPMELIAIVAAVQLAAHVQTPTTEEIVTDSLGCCQIANRRKQHPQLTNDYIALMNPLQHYLKDFKGKIKRTPAQPEKRN